ncbi:unnamed protein product [Heligmosomoides polygyrus]|uniref:Uncharacterized protein n=1 Tax=Heligmosomoides polygyrus TaxID=6339 RepID=A0A183FF92_HELPZ|nr:unnamed protein product [Heligmosomoides polygyrus]
MRLTRGAYGVAFQDQVISGSLPCPREEAAYLASIQLCVDEQWPGNKRTQTIRRHLLKGQFGRIRDLAQKIMITPWEVDQNLYCTPPRFPYAPNAGTTTRCSKSYSIKNQWYNNFSYRAQIVEESTHRPRTPTLLRCITNTEGLMSEELQAQCLPVDLRGDRRTIKLVQERKRKLFHSQVYESEAGMKRLYIQVGSLLSNKLNGGVWGTSYKKYEVCDLLGCPESICRKFRNTPDFF